MTEDIPVGNKLFGVYRGKVLKHLSNGFCKIYIPSVYPEEWNNYENADKLPSAEQAASLFGGTNNGNGVFSYPNISSTVWCFFANNDQNYPVYFASTLGGINAATQLSTETTPELSGNWDKARAMAGSHPNDAYVHKIHAKNSDIEIYESGMVKVHTEGKDKKTCDLTLDASGNAILETSSTIVLKSQNIKLDASTQIDFIAPNVITTSEINTSVISKAIALSSVTGHTTIVTQSGTTTL